MKRLAIIVGHNSEKQGAVRADTGETEFVWNSRLARRIERLAGGYGIETKTFFRTPGLGYSREIARVYDESDRWKPEASVELHFNGALSQSATGTETLSSGTSLSLRLAESVNREMVAALGLRDRGIRTRAASERGGGSLHSGKAPAILIEPFFGSSPVGQRATDEDHEQEALADAILRGAAEAFQSFPRSDLSESRTLKAAAKQKAAANTGGTATACAAIAAQAMSVKDEIEALPAIGGISEYLPFIAAGMGVVALGAFVYSRVMTGKIEDARYDDSDREIR